MIPEEMFFTKGVGIHKEKLQSFELALRSAGISQTNIVTVSSIFPPKCKIIKRSDGLNKIKPGQIQFCVMARNETNEHNRLVAASIGLAKPSNKDTYGYLSEHHSFGQTQKEVGDYAEDLAASMLASTLGIDMDVDKAWDERREIYKMSGKIVKTKSTSQTAAGIRDCWVTVIAAAVFVM